MSPISSPIHEDYDDFPLTSSNMSGAAAGVKRSHTIAGNSSSGSRLSRINSNSGSIGSHRSSGHASPVASLGLSAHSQGPSMDNSRRGSGTSGGHVQQQQQYSSTTSPVTRTGATVSSTQDHQAGGRQYDARTLAEDENNEHDDDQIIQYITNSGSTSSLARHSSMPISRAVRRGNNAGAPWRRNREDLSGSGDTAPTGSTALDENAQNRNRMRSNSTAELLAFAQPPISPIDKFFSTTSPLVSSSNNSHHTSNSGFVVTSRPSAMRSAVSQASPISPGTGSSNGSTSSAHMRNRSINNGSSLDGPSFSPTHSRHGSDGLLGASNNPASVLKLGSTGSGGSTPSPASPIDRSLLGQANPWSPTAEERMHFREFSAGSSSAAAVAAASGSAFQQSLLDDGSASSLRRSNSGSSATARSRTVTAPGVSTSSVLSPIAGPSAVTTPPALHAQGGRFTVPERQPTRRNTPLLPPLVTSSDALISGAIKTQQSQYQQAHTAHPSKLVSEETRSPIEEALPSSPSQRLPKAGNPLQRDVANARVLQGPASAAPYVPPIGHTHHSILSGRLPFSSTSTRQSQKPTAEIPQSPAAGPSAAAKATEQVRMAGQPFSARPTASPPLPKVQSSTTGNINGLYNRAVNTAGPGIGQSSFLDSKDRLVGGVSAGHSLMRSLSHNGASENHVTSPATATGSTLPFPSLVSTPNGDHSSAAASHLAMQQQLLAQQTRALQEQQTQLAAALSAGLSLNAGQADYSSAAFGLPNQQQSSDPYALAARIDALQKANAAMSAQQPYSNGHPGMQSPPAGQAHYQQQPLSGFAPFSPMPQQATLPHANGVASPFLSNGFMASPQLHQQHAPYQIHQPGGASPFLSPSYMSTNGSIAGGTFPTAELAALVAGKGYNPSTFDTNPPRARFFVIKSYTEDDVFKSIKFEIWSSTPLGNNRLDKAYKEAKNGHATSQPSQKGSQAANSAATGQENGENVPQPGETTDNGNAMPIYLFFSVNASGHFCGVAEMLSPLDYSVDSNVWSQNDKWKGVMKLKWIYIRDIPNPALRHLRLLNTAEQKPVTSSRDTQEVPYEQGCEMLRIFHTYPAKTSLLQDYAYYQSQSDFGALFRAGAEKEDGTKPAQATGANHHFSQHSAGAVLQQQAGGYARPTHYQQLQQQQNKHSGQTQAYLHNQPSQLQHQQMYNNRPAYR